MSRSKPLCASIVLAALLAAAAASAHHSIAGVYDTARTTTIEARVVEFRFVNPHPVLVVEVAGAAGPQTWQLEMDNRFELVAIGMDDATLVPGDRVVAAGSLGRTDTQRLYVRRLERPSDGLLYEQRGMTPSLVRPAPNAR